MDVEIVLSDLCHQSNWNWQLYQKTTLSVILYRKESGAFDMLPLGKVSFWADAPSCPGISRLYRSDRLIQLFMTWADTCWQHVWHQRYLRPSTSNETCNLLILWNSACQDFIQHRMSCPTVEFLKSKIRDPCSWTKTPGKWNNSFQGTSVVLLSCIILAELDTAWLCKAGEWPWTDQGGRLSWVWCNISLDRQSWTGNWSQYWSVLPPVLPWNCRRSLYCLKIVQFKAVDAFFSWKVQHMPGVLHNIKWYCHICCWFPETFTRRCACL